MSDSDWGVYCRIRWYEVLRRPHPSTWATGY